MRPLFIFLLFICLHLLGGCESACAGNHAYIAFYSPARNRVETPQHTWPAGIRESRLSGHRDLPAENEFPIVAEDDDDREESTKKSKSSVWGPSTAFCAFITAQPPGDLAANLFFRRPPFYTDHCKYILRRVLRI